MFTAEGTCVLVTTLSILAAAVFFVAATYSLRLARLAGGRTAWWTLAAAFLLLAAQQALRVLRPNAPVALTSELVVFLGASLALSGVFVMTRLLDSLHGREAALAESRDRLEQLVDQRTGEYREVNHQLEDEIAVRERAEADLLVERNLLRTTLDHLPDHIFIKDADSRFTITNRFHLHNLGVDSLEQVVGKTDFDFFPRELAEQYYCDERHVVESGEALLNREERMRDPEGDEIWLLTTKVPVKDPEGKVVALVGISHNITARKRAEERIRAIADELARSNRELEQFAFVASHDLQEPLRKILAFGDRLNRVSAAKLDEQAADYLARMLNAAERMKALIESLLTYSRVTTRAREFQPVDLNETLSAVLTDLEYMIERTGGKVEVEPLFPVLADSAQMRQLFQNLISNALKFARPGVPPQVRVFADDAGRIVVQDNGIGFDEKFVDRIFTIFQRLHARDEYEGTGIGLSVCKKIVERHGGEIVVNSVPGEGSVFRVELPANKEGVS